MKLREDLPIKYYLNSHNEEGLQDNLAALFDIIQYLLKVSQSKGKEFDINNIKFTTKSLKYIFTDKIVDETFKGNLVKKLKEYISNNLIRVDGDTLYITEKGLTQFYII